MYCRQCGYNNDQYSKLCHRCGSVLREAEDHYEAPEKTADETEQSGVLKYARKGEDLLSQLKAPFRQLERVTENHRKRWPILITIASVIAICIVVWLIVLSSNACNEVEEIIYGNTPANNIQNSIAAADDNYIYYTCPFGENPGLYRLSISTGENLKISYHRLESLSVVDGWVYGIDPDGTVLRISSDGLASQQVIEEKYVKQPIVVGDYLYYISGDCCIYRANVNTITKRSFARPVQLSETMTTQFCIFEDIIYFLELTEEDYSRIFTVSTVVTPEPVTDSEGKKVELDPYTITEVVPPENGADIPECSGCIRRMTLDGENESELLATPVMRLTAGSGYLFFQTETTAIISATDIDPNAPADMDYEIPAKKCWRLNLETLKYSTLLEANTADSPMTPTSDGWVYYIGVDGNLERTDFSGSDRHNVLTYEQDTDRIAICGGFVFVLTDGETRMIRMLPDGTEHLLLCEAIPEVTQSQTE